MRDHSKYLSKEYGYEEGQNKLIQTPGYRLWAYTGPKNVENGKHKFTDWPRIVGKRYCDLHNCHYNSCNSVCLYKSFGVYTGICGEHFELILPEYNNKTGI